MRGLTLVDGKRAVTLAGGDEVASSIGQVVHRQPFYVCRQAVFAHGGNFRPLGTILRLGIEVPDADRLFGYVKLALLIVSDHALDGTTQAHLAHRLLGRYPAATVVDELKLLDLCLRPKRRLGAGKRVKPACLRAPVKRDAVARTGVDLAIVDLFQMAAHHIYFVDADLVCAAFVEGDDIDRLFGQREAIARVDVAGLLSRDDLQRFAGQIVDKDFVRLLVRRNDRALRKVARVKPEREVVLVSSLRGLQRQARTNSRLRSGEAGVKRQQQKEYGDASATCHTVHSSCRNLPEGRCRARSRGQDRS